MKSKKDVSIIIRTKNEEKWISLCLDMVFEQDYENFEVIIVDNNSTDKTIEKVRRYDLKVINVTEYRPGKALNQGIKESEGELIVCLSGHCIPANEKWLSKLIRNFENAGVAGVYGRQEPLSFTSDADKRDLINTFRLERIVQSKDSFFHNANSAIRRCIWNEIPFNEDVTNIEDRLWGKAVIEKGLSLIYEPEASVYHHHGINHDGDKERCKNVVRILEALNDKNGTPRTLADRKATVIAIVPFRGEMTYLANKPLLYYTIEALKKSALIRDIFVSTDNEKTAKIAEELGAKTPFLRPDNLSKEYVSIESVLRYALERIENSGYYPDLVVLAEATYPFRPVGIFDKLIQETLMRGLDTLIVSHQEYRVSWIKEDYSLRKIIEFKPRSLKSPIYVGMLGLGCVTYPKIIRDELLLSGKIGIFEINNKFCAIEVRNEYDHEVANNLIGPWTSGLNEIC